MAVSVEPTGNEVRVSPKGRARRDSIVAAARACLDRRGAGEFTLRAVAQGAGLSLSHLQYYFPTKGDLLRAIIESVAADYSRGAADALAAVPDAPMARFLAWIDYLIADCWQPETRRFFIQLWGLLETEDEQAGSLLREFYAYDIDAIAALLAALSPHVDAALVRHRATIIASLIEGMMLMVADAAGDADDDRALIGETRRQIIRIATEP